MSEKIYVTFTPRDHYLIGGIKFNHHCVAEIEGVDHDDCTKQLDKAFANGYHFDYSEEEFIKSGERLLRHCSRGLVRVPNNV